MGHYYDTNEIIMEEELLSVVFQKDAKGVEILDPSAESNIVEQGSKVEIPFWLAQELNRREAVVINVPACFDQKVSDKTIGALLLYAFKNRYKDVLIKAHTVAFSVAPKFLSLLTEEETKLFEAAQSSMAAFKKWRQGGARFQRAAILGKKRKPDD